MSKLPKLYFTYGFSASGKTTWSKKFLERNPETIYLSADEVRKELYGSQDIYGNGEEIYKVILKRMVNSLKEGRNVLYDACNLYKSYRMDYLNELEKEGIKCYKTIVRLNTDKKTCYERHRKRQRKFDIEKIAYYLDINEPPTMEEGWDDVIDISYSDFALQFYIASPFFNPEHRKRAIEVAEHFRKLGHTVFLPCEHKFENAYDMPNYKWGEEVFKKDVRAIDNSNWLICLSYGREGSAGTAWELGYAYGICLPSVVVEMPETELMSIMVSNGSLAVVRGINELYKYDFDEALEIKDLEMEQK